MGKSWDIDVKGKNHKVVVDLAESGKDVIRVDGRTVARPLSAEELERVFAVDGHRYSVRRSGAHEFDLNAIDAEPAQAAAFVASGKEEAIDLGRPLEGRKKLIIAWAAIVVAIGLMLLWAKGPSYEKLAAKRLEEVLTYMKVGNIQTAYFALPTWMLNTKTLSRDDEDWATTHFDQWRNARDLNHPFSSFKILESKMVKGSNPRAAVVTFEIEGKTYKALVTESLPIRWAE